jgi:hypothetical protein
MSLHITRSARVRLIKVYTQFPNTLGTHCRASTCCMNVSYVVGHVRARSISVSLRLVYFVSIGDTVMYMWILICYKEKGGTR